MDSNANSLNWFEIPVTDMNRAKKFYEAVFGIQMHQMDMMGMTMAMFPQEDMNGKVSGALVQSNQHKPSMDGAKVYLNGNPDLGGALSRVEAAGGKVVMPKMKINDEVGYMAFFIDSEGNNVGLHSSPEKK